MLYIVSEKTVLIQPPDLFDKIWSTSLYDLIAFKNTSEQNNCLR